MAAANLTRAILSCGSPNQVDCAKLDHANLSGANLHQTRLSGASLNYANLSGAFMGSAVLGNTSLMGQTSREHINAILHETDLRLADLRGAEIFNVDGIGTVIWSNTVCPDGTNSNDNDGDGFTCETNLSGSIYGP